MTESNKPRLITYLEGLNGENKDRAALAALRSSLQQENPIEGLRLVLPTLKAGSNRFEEDDAILLAGLFALHPETGSSSIAEALKIVFRKTESESIENRFRALLGAKKTELSTHLRHAVSLIGSKQIALDWNDLYRAIRYWDHPDDFIRRKWARSFWAEKNGDNDNDENQQVNNSTEEKKS